MHKYYKEVLKLPEFKICSHGIQLPRQASSVSLSIFSQSLIVDLCLDALPTGEKYCQLSTDDYVKVLWTTAAEFPGEFEWYLRNGRIVKARTVLTAV